MGTKINNDLTTLYFFFNRFGYSKKTTLQAGSIAKNVYQTFFLTLRPLAAHCFFLFFESNQLIEIPCSKTHNL